jgi:hypothetical protein
MLKNKRGDLMELLSNPQGYKIYLLASNQEINLVPPEYDCVIEYFAPEDICFVTVKKASQQLSSIEIRSAYCLQASRAKAKRANGLVTFTVQGNLTHVALALKKYLIEGKPVDDRIVF